MKILQINVVYNVGSTGRITANIHHYLLEHGVDSYVIYGHDKKANESHVYRTRPDLEAKIWHFASLFTGNFYGGVPVGTHRVIHLIEQIKPDVVHLQCINGYFVSIPRILTYLKNHQIKTVLTLHADFMFTGSCSYADDCEKWRTGCGHCPNLKKFGGPLCLDFTSHYWKKMFKALSDFSTLEVVSVSPWLMNRAKTSPMMKNAHHSAINNGIDTSVFKRCDVAELRTKLDLKNNKILLYVSSVFGDEMKGGNNILRLADNLKTEPIKIMIVGAEKNMAFPSNIINVGKVGSPGEMAQYYSLADLTVLTSKREAFSMICAESLCCGTPIVGFQAGGPESISLKEYSEFVPYGDIGLLATTVKTWLGKENVDREMISQLGIEAYSKERMAKEYLSLYEGLNK